jgi:hypothetical protein
MYDPTWVPYNNDIWSLLETEQHYLVGTPEGETLSRIRYSPPGESPLKVTHDAKLDAAGNLGGVLEMHGSGAMDSRLRRMVTGVRRRELDARAAELLAAASPRVEDVRVTHRVPDDFGGDMWVRIEYSIPQFARPVAGGLEFRSPMMTVLLSDGNLFGTGGQRWSEERDTDLMLWYTQLVDATETIKVPGGLKLMGEPAIDEVDETYAAFAGSATQKGSTLTVTQRAEVRRRQIPPDGYPGFVKAMAAAREWGDQVFRVAEEEK